MIYSYPPGLSSPGGITAKGGTFALFFRPYRPQKKWFKGIAREVVSLGFPDSKLAEIIEGHETEKPDEKMIEIKGTPQVDEEAFVEWKSALSSPDTPLPATTPSDGNTADSVTMDNLLARLAAFRVESATPVQCMLFITELQKENDLACGIKSPAIPAIAQTGPVATSCPNPSARRLPYPPSGGRFSPGRSIQRSFFLPAAGNRNNSDGSSNNRGTNGNYWSSTPSGTNAANVNFNSATVSANTNNRANGFSVRCLRGITGRSFLQYKQTGWWPRSPTHKNNMIWQTH